jgi:hypothetical protein
VNVISTEDIEWEAGDVVTLYPVVAGTYRQMIIKSVTLGAQYHYAIVFDSEYSLGTFSEGDYVLFGMIPFDYGIKWTDFGNPQYLKQVREVHLDQYGMTGKIFMDHFKDLNETPVSVEVKDVLPTDSKLVFPFRMGNSYIYGFRIRGWSSTAFKINAFERVFTVKV